MSNTNLAEKKNVVEFYNNKMDMRAFFRDVEKGVRSFLAHYDRQAKLDDTLFPYRMPEDAWWREFLKWAKANKTRPKNNDIE
jgi:hypothetical protein